MHDNPDLLFVIAFFTELQRQEVPYCILRNVNEVMRGDAHDIDMTVAADKLYLTEKILSETAHKLNWKLHLQTGSCKDKYNYKSYHYFSLDDHKQQINIVHIDLIPTFTWKGYELLSNDAMLTDIRPNGLFPTASPSVEAFCKLFSRLIFNGYVKDEYKADIQKAFKENPESILSLLLGFLTPANARQVYTLASSGEWDKLVTERNKVIKEIRKKAKSSRLGYYLYILRKAIKRKGLIVAFQGTDGSGKSTIIQGLPSVIGNTYSGSAINYYHWRPDVLLSRKKHTNDSTCGTTVQPHGSPPLGKLKSFAKLVFYVLDYISGYIGRVYWQAAQGHLVIFDRYYYDFYTDKLRYRLSISNFWIRLFQYFIPKPDITFLLIGDPQQIFERKKELPVEEIQRQIDILIKYKELFANPRIIDVSKPITSVLHDVSSEILTKLQSRA